MVTDWLDRMIGHRLTAVTEARYWHEGRRDPDAESLLHAWLHFDDAEPMMLHGHGDQLVLTSEEPYWPYRMGGYGETRVGPAQLPDVLAAFIGATLADAAVILAGESCAGLVLRFTRDDGTRADLVIGACGDGWVLGGDLAAASGVPNWGVGAFIRRSQG